jgi:hypothetical protein
LKRVSVILTISVIYKFPNIVYSFSDFIIWLDEIVISVKRVYQMRLFCLVALFTFHMVQEEAKYREYRQIVIQYAAKCFSLSFREKLTEPLMLLFASVLPLRSVPSETFCHFNLLIRFSVCTPPPPFTTVLSYFCPFDFFLFFLRRPDRSISSIECRVTCVDSS